MIQKFDRSMSIYHLPISLNCWSVNQPITDSVHRKVNESGNQSAVSQQSISQSVDSPSVNPASAVNQSVMQS